MIRTGLVSISFRKLDPVSVVRLAAEAGLSGVEWGGDVHVPPGETDKASQVVKLTREAGLETAAYGSYYEAGCGDPGEEAFKQVVQTAGILGAPTIRAWAGNTGSANAGPEDRKRMAESARRMADLAGSAGITVSFEFHAGTLNDTNESAARFYAEVSHPSVCAYWQPDPKMDETKRAEGLEMLLPILSNIHVFHWTLDEKMRFVRHSLVDGAADWTKYLGQAADLPGKHFALLEFMPDDDPASLKEEAAVLRNLLNGLESSG